MKVLQDDSLARRCAGLIRDRQTPDLSQTDSRRMVRQAILAGAGQRRKSREIRIWAVATALLCLVIVGITFYRNKPVIWNQPTAQPLRMRLPSSDLVIATPDADFELETATLEKRRVMLTKGAALFDVNPLRPGEYFQVVTPDMRVTVQGTVFTVDVTRSRTVLRVYQGRVQAESSGKKRLIKANESFASDNTEVSVTDGAPLYREALESIRDRKKTMLEERPTNARADQSASGSSFDQDSLVRQDIKDKGSAGAPVKSSKRTLSEPSNTTTQPTLIQARAWLEGKYFRASLLAARAAVADSADAKGDWKMLEADALRAMGHFGEAAQAYGQAAQLLAYSRKVQAGYLAALLYYQKLDLPMRAFAQLDAAGVDQPGSPLRERGLLLRARIMRRLGRSARDMALLYLQSYPESAAADEMRGYLERSFDRSRKP